MASSAAIEKSVCSICGNSNLCELADLPNFPITGVFVSESDPGPAKGFDQAFDRCAGCGHAQLRTMLPPADLYGDNYPHRSSASHITPTAFKFVLAFLDEIAPDRRFRSILEIGCNDLMLLKQVAPRAETATGIDPIWLGKNSPAEANITVIGNFLEDVDLEKELDTPPDLVISTHNLEHICDPVTEMRRLMEFAADDAMFVIEVPDFDAMVRNLRFDQIFHQHIHYFSLKSFIRMVEAIGGHYLTHTVNPHNWGGTFIVAFTKSQPEAVATPPADHLSDDRVLQQYTLFRDHMATISKVVRGLDGEIWGYGAAQMLPTLSYHMRDDLSFLTGIYDDCKFRPGLTYPHIPVRIHRPAEDLQLPDATVMITALDAVRPIMNRLRDFNPGYVVVPSAVY